MSLEIYRHILFKELPKGVPPPLAGGAGGGGFPKVTDRTQFPVKKIRFSRLKKFSPGIYTKQPG
jgi:hypothetical protein